MQNRPNVVDDNQRSAKYCQLPYLKLFNTDGTAKLPGSLSKRNLGKGSKDLFAPALARMPITRFCRARWTRQLVVHEDCSTKSLDLFRLATPMSRDGCRIHPVSKKLCPCDANHHKIPLQLLFQLSALIQKPLLRGHVASE